VQNYLNKAKNNKNYLKNVNKSRRRVATANKWIRYNIKWGNYFKNLKRGQSRRQNRHMSNLTNEYYSNSAKNHMRYYNYWKKKATYYVNRLKKYIGYERIQAKRVRDFTPKVERLHKKYLGRKIRRNKHDWLHNVFILNQKKAK